MPSVEPMPGRGSRRRRPVEMALALGLFSLLCACSSLPRERPNIILILVDTLRADYLGSYGFVGDISPNLDRLAAESVLFENCFSQAPWTKPSIASLFTSTYPRVHKLTNHKGMFWGESGEEGQTGVLPDDMVTLAESLRDSGYQTAAFVANPWIAKTFGFAQGFELFDNDHVGRQVPGDVLLAAARDWLRARESDAPFFLYIHLMDVHDPFDAPVRDSVKLKDSPSLGADRKLAKPPPKYLLSRSNPAFTEAAKKTLKFWRSRYAANVRAADRKLSFFLDVLESTGVLDSSYLVLTSDHGDELFEHGGWTHGFSLHHHQIHVPLLVRNPRGIGGGRRVSTGVQLIDLMPTLVSLAGGNVPEGAQGVDLSRLLRSDESREGAFQSYASAVRLVPNMYSVRTERYSLLMNLNTDETWLYDRLEDPGEQWNIAIRKPELVEELRRQVTAHLEEMDTVQAAEPRQIKVDDEELRQRLEALGYIN